MYEKAFADNKGAKLAIHVTSFNEAFPQVRSIILAPVGRNPAVAGPGRRAEHCAHDRSDASRGWSPL